jgi:hypothetical protein
VTTFATAHNNNKHVNLSVRKDGPVEPLKHFLQQRQAEVVEDLGGGVSGAEATVHELKNEDEEEWTTRRVREEWRVREGIIVTQKKEKKKRKRKKQGRSSLDHL